MPRKGVTQAQLTKSAKKVARAFQRWNSSPSPTNSPEEEQERYRLLNACRLLAGKFTPDERK